MWEYKFPHDISWKPYLKFFSDYFRKNKVPTLLSKELFLFVIDKKIKLQNLAEHVEKLKEESSNRDPEELSPEDQEDEDYFRAAEITKSLNEVNPGYTHFFIQIFIVLMT